MDPVKLHFDYRDIFRAPRMALSGKKIWTYVVGNLIGYIGYFVLTNIAPLLLRRFTYYLQTAQRKWFLFIRRCLGLHQKTLAPCRFYLSLNRFNYCIFYSDGTCFCLAGKNSIHRRTIIRHSLPPLLFWSFIHCVFCRCSDYGRNLYPCYCGSLWRGYDGHRLIILRL